MKYGIGQPVLRREDHRLVSGKGRFTDDNRFEGQCHAHVVYSTRAHADVVRIDRRRALEMPGVLAVLTGEDCEADGIGGIQPRFLPQDFGWGTAHRTSRPILASGRIRHVGERVAVVVAETREAARAAARLIEVEYDDRPPVIGIEAALAENAPAVYEDVPGNRVWTMRFGDASATNKAFAAAAHRVKVQFKHPRLAPSPMEPRSAIGLYSQSDDLYTLYTGTQAPHILRAEIAAFCLKVPEVSIRVVSQDVGGGFGLKTTLFAEDVIVLWAARRLGRPVKWTGTRSDNLISDDQGRGSGGWAELALDENGHILGYRTRTFHDVGAYIVGAGTMPMVHTTKLVPSLYRIPALDAEGTLVFTNAPPTTPYRGAGRPEAVFAIEKALDAAARQIGLDRLEIRRRNLIPKEELPYRSHTGFVYDSGEFHTILDRCAGIADWAGFPARKVESAKRGRLRGQGVAYYTHDTGNLNDRMEIRFDPSGSVTVFSGTASTGMGHETVYAQMVSEWLGVPFDSIRIVASDTQAVHFGRGSYASRSMTVGGSALKVAAGKIIERAKIVAGRLLNVTEGEIEFDEGIFRSKRTNANLTIQEVARASFRPNMPIDGGIGLEAVGTFAVTQPSFPNGCHICEIEIDPQTGQVRVDRYTVVDDFGRVINPLLVEGQVQGGIAQGFGAVFSEEMAYDPDSGSLRTGTFAEYALPRAGQLFDTATTFHEVPCTTNPAGVKGAGEGGTVGSEACLFSAAIDALDGYEVSDLQMPLTTVKLWRIIACGPRQA